MKHPVFACAAAIAALGLIAASPERASAQDGPEISDTGWCASVYGAFARAQTRKSKTPRRLHETAGFMSIDFAKRRAAIDAKLSKAEGFSVTYYQQVYEEAFDGAGYANLDGKPAPDAAERLMTDAVTRARGCDKIHGFQPALLDRLAASPTPPIEPYACAVNYAAIGMGMRDPAEQQKARNGIAAALMRYDPSMAEDWRDIARARVQADAQERNRAVGAKQVTPEQLFAMAQACGQLLTAR